MSNDHDPSQPLPEFSDVTAEEQLDWNRLAAYLR